MEIRPTDNEFQQVNAQFGLFGRSPNENLPIPAFSVVKVNKTIIQGGTEHDPSNVRAELEEHLLLG